MRYHEDATFRHLYTSADYVLLDSRFAAHLLRLLKGLRLPVCPGADLTAHLFSQVIRPEDRIVLIGGTEDQARHLTRAHRLENLRHYNPPMGFIGRARAVEECLRFVEDASPFRFCFFAVGSPQQETLAALLKRRGVARGLALCVGASINFLTGAERRAPAWMRRAGLEWLYRLLRNPRRLVWRYLVRGPRVLLYLPRAQIVLRKRSAAPPARRANVDPIREP